MQQLVTTLRSSFAYLAAQTDLTPREDINQHFSAIVSSALTPAAPEQTQQILAEIESDIGLAKLRSLCGSGETVLENYWAKRLANAADVEAELEYFPYLNNYRKMVASELTLMQLVGFRGQHILLAGSGPLPLTAYFLAKDHNFRVTCLDFDDTANQFASAWMSRLAFPLDISFVTENILTLSSLQPYDAVWLCALTLGQTEPEQARMFTNIAEKITPQQLVGVRSTAGLRRLLYPEVFNCENMGMERIAEYHPQDDVVNSFLVYRKSAIC